MKVLTVQQPWAWLIVNGFKDVENRTWPTKVRGQVAIHASQKYDEWADVWLRRNFPHIPLPPREAIERGGVVGVATITDCVKRHSSPWFQGTYGFVLTKAQPVPFIPLRGHLGFFDADVPGLASPDPAVAVSGSPVNPELVQPTAGPGEGGSLPRMDSFLSRLPLILRELGGHTYSFRDEAQFHQGIATVLKLAGVPFVREYRASGADRLDFLCEGGIAIEAKIKGSLSPAIRQCARYCLLDSVNAVVLVTNRHWGVTHQDDVEIHGKRIVTVHALGMAF